MMNISKVQAHKLPKAKSVTGMLIARWSKFQFPWLFSDHFGIPRLFQVFQVSGHPALKKRRATKRLRYKMSGISVALQRFNAVLIHESSVASDVEPDL